MKHIPNVLLVEGSNDKSFFENLCKKYNLNVQVKVKNPRDLLTTQGVFNSKRGVIDSLEELLPLLEDEDSLDILKDNYKEINKIISFSEDESQDFKNAVIEKSKNNSDVNTLANLLGLIKDKKDK